MVNKPVPLSLHWENFSILIRCAKIFFFDSAGDKAPKRVMTLAKRIIKQGKKLNMKFVFDQNHPVEHQYGDSECGIYSLFFISHMLEDKFTENYLKTHILKLGVMPMDQKL